MLRVMFVAIDLCSSCAESFKASPQRPALKRSHCPHSMSIVIKSSLGSSDRSVGLGIGVK